VPNQRAITEYETAVSGIPDCFDCLSGDSLRGISEDAASGNPGTYPAKEADTFIRAHFEMLDTWRDHLDQLDSQIRGDVIEGSIPKQTEQYLKQQARALFAAQQTLLRAVAEYHHGTAGPLLDPDYGYAYGLSNSVISPV
jgi:hypothetical protein